MPDKPTAEARARVEAAYRRFLEAVGRVRGRQAEEADLAAIRAKYDADALARLPDLERGRDQARRAGERSGGC
jgi:hypothetical protein